MYQPEQRKRLIDRPQSYQDMQARPAFQAVLDQREHKLSRVLTDYHFAQKCQCGLRSCRTPHKGGFLVETADGLETNIGNVCGRNTFGESFLVARATYMRAREREELEQRVRSILAQGGDMARRIHDLETAQYGVPWVRAVRRAFHGLLGADLFEALRVAQKRKDLTVTHARERSAAEIEQIMARNRVPREQVRYVTTTLGVLQEMPWIDFDFTGRLRSGLLEPLTQLGLIDLERAPSPLLKQKVRHFEGWEDTLRAAGEAANSALLMLGRENLALLGLWIPEHMVARRRAVSAWIDSGEHQALLRGYPG